MLPRKNVLWFSEIRPEDLTFVGPEGERLAALVRAGLPVPPGFVLVDPNAPFPIDREIGQALEELGGGVPFHVRGPDGRSEVVVGREPLLRRLGALAGPVVVQESLAASRSGSARTEREATVVEAVFGLRFAEGIEPDVYRVARHGGRVLAAHAGHKPFEILRGPDGREHRVARDPEELLERVLEDAEAVRVAELALKRERQTGRPQRLAWEERDGDLYVLSAEPLEAPAGAPTADQYL